MEKLTKL